jgi:hypothetical protein
VTSHSSQGQTAGRVLVHVETDRSSEKLVNQPLAYVAVARGQYDARIYTDDKAKLARALSRDVSHRSALEHDRGHRWHMLRTEAFHEPNRDRRVSQSPPLEYESTVLSGVKGALRRLRRP